MFLEKSLKMTAIFFSETLFCSVCSSLSPAQFTSTEMCIIIIIIIIIIITGATGKSIIILHYIKLRV